MNGRMSKKVGRPIKTTAQYFEQKWIVECWRQWDGRQTPVRQSMSAAWSSSSWTTPRCPHLLATCRAVTQFCNTTTTTSSHAQTHVSLVWQRQLPLTPVVLYTRRRCFCSVLTVLNPRRGLFALWAITLNAYLSLVFWSNCPTIPSPIHNMMLLSQFLPFKNNIFNGLLSNIAVAVDSFAEWETKATKRIIDNANS